jgi:tRNA (guanine37-N1)-methyltransferase
MSDIESARTDSFFDRELSAPSYTKPAEYRGFSVPEVLLSGNHAKIDEWRRQEGDRLSRKRRGEG